VNKSKPMTTRQYGRLLDVWIVNCRDRAGAGRRASYGLRAACPWRIPDYAAIGV
jgi:hypothetical protein